MIVELCPHGEAKPHRWPQDWADCPGGRVLKEAIIIEAIARSRYEARFGEGSWEDSPGYDRDGYSLDAFRGSAKRDWQAALVAIESQA